MTDLDTTVFSVQSNSRQMRRNLRFITCQQNRSLQTFIESLAATGKKGLNALVSPHDIKCYRQFLI